MSTSKVHQISPVHSNGEVRCYRHNDTVLKAKVSRTEKNPNRVFYSCQVEDGPDGEKCSFFKWEDELSLTSPPPSQSSPTPSSKFKPATSLKRPASTEEHELSPAAKRLNAPYKAPSSSPRTPASQARLDAMRRAQGLPIEANTSTPTPRRSPSPTPQSSRSADTPKAPRTIPSWFASSATLSSRPATPPPTAECTEPRWPPQTPPFSSRVRVPPAQSEHARQTRNGQNIEQSRHSLGTSPNSDPRLDVDPFCSPSASKTRSGGSAPRGETAPRNSLVSADTGEMSAAAQVMDDAQRIAAYITKLELRLSAAEKSNDTKACRMELMQEEIDKLKARNVELERTLANLT